MLGDTLSDVQEKINSTNISNVDIFDLMINNDVADREFIYSDSAYYQQPNRKLAIIKGKYKYIYNKKNRHIV